MREELGHIDERHEHIIIIIIIMIVDKKRRQKKNRRNGEHSELLIFCDRDMLLTCIINVGGRILPHFYFSVHFQGQVLQMQTLFARLLEHKHIL